MGWTFDEISRDWFGGTYLSDWDAADVERAFTLAEEVRGRDWVLGAECGLDGMVLPGIGNRGGFSQFHRVYWFGTRMRAIVGVPGAASLRDRLVAGDAAAESELTAIHLLRSRHPDTEGEIAPAVTVGNRVRRPDFMIRQRNGVWAYVEVTQLARSGPSSRLHRLLERVAARLIAVPRPFLLEIVFWREPTEAEEDEVFVHAAAAAESADGRPRDIGGCATILVKAGEPATVVPSVLPGDTRPRMVLSSSIVGPGQPNRGA